MIQQRLSRVVFLAIICSVDIIHSSEAFFIKRVQPPLSTQIKAEEYAQRNRQIKRSAIKYSTIAAVCGALYVSYKASEYFKDMDKAVKALQEEQKNKKLVEAFGQSALEKLKKYIPLNLIEDKKPMSNGVSWLAPIWWTGDVLKNTTIGLKDFCKDMGKAFIESAPTFIVGMVLSNAWNQFTENRAEALKQESISWFVDKHTKLWPLFIDLKSACVSYDLYSELLSSQILHETTHTHIKTFVKNVTDLVKAHKEGCLDDDFFNYQCEDIKKQCAKKGSEIETLQNYATPAVAKQKRANKNIQEAYLFGTAATGKQDIADICNALVEYVQKVAAFTIVHLEKHRLALTNSAYERGQLKISQMIMMTNAYLDTMQILLNTDLERLVEISKTNQGMFTITYEFEKHFREIIVSIHRYCLMLEDE